MTDQPGGELAKSVPLQPIIEQYAGEFTKVLPARIGQDRYERWCLSFLRQAVSGQQADTWRKILTTPAGQLSVMQAFMDCASLGLEPGRTYHLVPYGSEVAGITDYKGEIQLIYNAGKFPVCAMLVRANDDFGMRGANVPPMHEADWFGDRGPVTGGYAYCQFRPDVYSLVVLMNEADFLHHRDKARTKGVWDEWPEQMRLKTLVHQLRKFVPWSAEVQP